MPVCTLKQIFLAVIIHLFILANKRSAPNALQMYVMETKSTILVLCINAVQTLAETCELSSQI